MATKPMKQQLAEKDAELKQKQRDLDFAQALAAKNQKEINDKIVEVTRRTAAEFIIHLPQMLQQRFEQSVAKILGFEKRWDGNWEIDHCNGRMSTISQYIDEETKKHVHESARKAITPELADKVLAETLPGLQQIFCHALKRALEHKVEEMAHEQAAEIAKRYSKLMLKEYEKQIMTDIDPADPKNTDKDPLSRMLLERAIQEALAGEGEAA